uniref:Uncharacterized protein n=1 Tax=Manihot esculenta TaxID=3983 RepID=A0A2C9U3L1_MANES
MLIVLYFMVLILYFMSKHYYRLSSLSFLTIVGMHQLKYSGRIFLFI